jgi:glycine hydroxymethyltransferase
MITMTHQKNSYLNNYFDQVKEEERTSAAIAYLAALDAISSSSPHIAQAIVRELRDQRSHLKLIASENFCSLSVQLAMGNLFTDKYSEGYPGHRFYAGCDNVDLVEHEAASLAKQIFGADHAYVQPHSGIDANLVAFWAILLQRIQSKEMERLSRKTLDELTTEEYETIRQKLVNQKIMGMALSSGGHLTHGYRYNCSSKMFQSVVYEVDPSTGLLDYRALQEQVRRERPLILIAGYSAYPRRLNFAKMREIADSVQAVLMVDMAHFAGLVAGKVMQGEEHPIPFAHVVTSTTHKTLRGPRGGFVLCTNEFKEWVDKSCPTVLGGPLPHIMAAKAVAFQEAARPSFVRYAEQIVANARELADVLMKKGVRLLTQGTDNHLLVIDVATSFGLTGRQAETILRQAHLTSNRNAIPQDVNGPWYTSGIRLGTAAVTTLGMKQDEMRELASIIVDLIKEAKPDRVEKTGTLSRAKASVHEQVIARAQKRVADLLEQFPLYPEIRL